jgi:hypothetical protein
MWEKVNVLRHMGRIAAADACLSEMTNRPGTLDSFLNPGFELQRLEQAQDVLALADAACDIDPSAAAAHHLRSWALERVGRLEEAIKAAATELWPTDASLRASLKSMRPAPKP